MLMVMMVMMVMMAMMTMTTMTTTTNISAYHRAHVQQKQPLHYDMHLIAPILRRNSKGKTYSLQYETAECDHKRLRVDSGPLTYLILSSSIRVGPFLLVHYKQQSARHRQLCCHLSSSLYLKQFKENSYYGGIFDTWIF